MNPIVQRWLACLILLLSAPWAQAAITCTVSSSGFSSTYLPSSGTINVTQTSFTATCTRNAPGDPTSLNYRVGVNDGANFSGTNRARSGASFLNYDTYQNATCGTAWGSVAGDRIVLSMTLANTVGAFQTVTINYWGCIPASQLAATGVYTDNLTLTVYDGPGNSGSPIANNTAPVQIAVPAQCNITAAPGAITLSYTAFGPAATANTTFGVTCGNTLPYTMALNATSGVVVGLNYSLALSSSGGAGTGLQQNHSITATIPANQAGTCASAICTGTQVHTLTITY